MEFNIYNDIVLFDKLTFRNKHKKWIYLGEFSGKKVIFEKMFIDFLKDCKAHWACFLKHDVESLFPHGYSFILIKPKNMVFVEFSYKVNVLINFFTRLNSSVNLKFVEDSCICYISDVGIRYIEKYIK